MLMKSARARGLLEGFAWPIFKRLKYAQGLSTSHAPPPFPAHMALAREVLLHALDEVALFAADSEAILLAVRLQYTHRLLADQT